MLDQWLKKKGIKSYYDLNEEEKATYREYEEALSGKRLTDEDVEKWLKTELDYAVSRVTEIDLKKEDEIFRKVEIRFIKKILNFINSPKVAKEFTERTLEQMIK